MASPVVTVDVSAVKARTGAQAIRRELSSVQKLVRSLEDSVQRLNRSFGGRTGGQGVANQFRTISTQSRSAEASLRRLGTEMQRIQRTRVVGPFVDLRRTAQQVRNPIQAVGRDMRNLGVIATGPVSQVPTQFTRLRREVRQSARTVNTFKNRMTELTKSVQLALGPLSGVAARITAFSGIVTQANLRVASFVGTLVGTGGFIFGAIRSARAIDEMRKSAERTGFAIEEFQGLVFAASQSGIEINQLTKALEAFSRRVTDAARGGGEAKDALEGLGIEMDGITKRAPIDVLKEVADRVSTLSSDFEKASVSADLFSRGQIRMIKLLEQGGQGIEDLIEKARRFGLILEEDLVRQSTETTDALDLLTKVLGTNFRRIFLSSGESIEKFAIIMARAGPTIKDNADLITAGVASIATALLGFAVGGPVGGLVGAGIGAAISSLILNTEEVADKLQSIGKKLQQEGPAGVDVQAIQNLGKFFEDLGASISVSDEELEDARDTLRTFFSEMKDGQNEIEKIRRSLDPLGAAFEDFRKQEGVIKKAFEEGNITLSERNRLLNLLERSFRDQLDPLGAVIRELELELELLGMSSSERKIQNRLIDIETKLRQKNAVEIKKTQRDEIRAILEQISKQEKAKEAAKEVDRVFTRASENIQDAFGDMFTEIFEKGENAFEDFGNTIKRIMARVAGEIAALLVFRPSAIAQAGGIGGAIGRVITGQSVGGGAAAAGGVGAGDALSLGNLLSGGASQQLGRFIADAALDVGLGTTAAGRGFFFQGGANLPFGAIGGIAANLLGLGSGNVVIDTLAGGAGAFLGGGLGASITALGSLGGPIGAALGAFAGTALGGLIGGGGFNNGPLTEGFTGVRNGRLTQTGFGSINEGDVQAGMQFLQSGIQFVNQLADLGVVTGINRGIRFDTKFGKFRTFVGPTPRNAAAPEGGFLGVGQDPENVLIDTIRNAVRRGFLNVDSPDVRSAIQNSAAETIQQFADDLDFAKAFSQLELGEEDLTQAEQALRAINEQFKQMSERARQLGLDISLLERARREAIRSLISGFNEQIRLQILQITDPFQAALEEQEQVAERRLREARALGADLVQVERLNALERQQIIEDFAQKSSDALRQLLIEITSGRASPLSPQRRLSLAEQRFNQLRTAALGGDPTARADLADAARNLLDASRLMFASGEQFFQRFNFVVSTLQNLTGESLPGFQHGGSFMVGGTAAPDSNMLSIGGRPVARVSRGEIVNISRGQQGDEAEMEMVRLLTMLLDAQEQSNQREAALEEEIAQLRRDIKLLMNAPSRRAS